MRARRGDLVVIGDSSAHCTALQVKATENLFEDFLSTLSGGESGASALDSIAELEQMVGVLWGRSWEENITVQGGVLLDRP